MNLFVAKLSSATTGKDLEELFSQFGEVVSSKVIFDKETGNSKGYGFVEMLDDEEAKAAIAALNDAELDGKKIVVKEALPRAENQEFRKNLRKRIDTPSRKDGFGNRYS